MQPKLTVDYNSKNNMLVFLFKVFLVWFICGLIGTIINLLDEESNTAWHLKYVGVSLFDVISLLTASAVGGVFLLLNSLGGKPEQLVDDLIDWAEDLLLVEPTGELEEDEVVEEDGFSEDADDNK